MFQITTLFLFIVFYISYLSSQATTNFTYYKCEINYKQWICTNNETCEIITNDFSVKVSEIIHRLNTIPYEINNVNITCIAVNTRIVCVNTDAKYFNNHTNENDYDYVINTTDNNVLNTLHIVIINYIHKTVENTIKFIEYLLSCPEDD